MMDWVEASAESAGDAASLRRRRSEPDRRDAMRPPADRVSPKAATAPAFNP